ncbi:MAG: hypothetical protein WCK32_04570 [Chlorobiaceae bacterium]
MLITKILRVFALFAILLASPLHSYATELRGRVDGMHPYAPKPFPFGGAKVDLYILLPRGARFIRSAYTGGDGMYYFSKIRPGKYTLIVNGKLNIPLLVEPRQSQDIPPILFR